ncbi:MAG: antitoxin VbhA family protein [Propionibacteriaceae bacterium]|nr:antitoxin VbhA family protein [Propionibacteriaceae bacterium]
MGSEVSYEEASAFADGVLGAAGHQVSDPELREISRRSFEGEISSEEAVALMLARVQAMSADPS